jgi:hypothetical protein
MRTAGLTALCVSVVAALACATNAHPAAIALIAAAALLVLLSIAHIVVPPREAATMHLVACGIAPLLGFLETSNFNAPGSGERMAEAVLAGGVGLAAMTIVGPLSAVMSPVVFARVGTGVLLLASLSATVDLLVGSPATLVSSAIGIAVASVMLARAGRKWRAFETYASCATEGLHLGGGRIRIGDDVVLVPTSAGLSPGPVLVWRPDVATGASYREGRRLDTRVVEGTAEDIRREAGEDRNARTALAVAWLALASAPAVGIVWSTLVGALDSSF